jgi:hypothetical protein
MMQLTPVPPLLLLLLHVLMTPCLLTHLPLLHLLLWG